MQHRISVLTRSLEKNIGNIKNNTTDLWAVVPQLAPAAAGAAKKKTTEANHKIIAKYIQNEWMKCELGEHTDHEFG